MPPNHDRLIKIIILSVVFYFGFHSVGDQKRGYSNKENILGLYFKGLNISKILEP